MATWYSKDVRNGVSALTLTEAIMTAFKPAFELAGAPPDMCLFSRHDLNRNVVTIYFSPRAEQVAKMFDATPCDKPSPDRLGPLAGHDDCMRIHYR